MPFPPRGVAALVRGVLHRSALERANALQPRAGSRPATLATLIGSLAAWPLVRRRFRGRATLPRCSAHRSSFRQSASQSARISSGPAWGCSVPDLAGGHAHRVDGAVRASGGWRGPARIRANTSVLRGRWARTLDDRPPNRGAADPAVAHRRVAIRVHCLSRRGGDHQLPSDRWPGPDPRGVIFSQVHWSSSPTIAASSVVLVGIALVIGLVIARLAPLSISGQGMGGPR